MKREDFLKGAFIPVALFGANLAKKLDPEGEPIREIDGAIIVNGDNVTLSNLNIVTRGNPQSGIAIKGSGAFVDHSTIRSDA